MDYVVTFKAGFREKVWADNYAISPNGDVTLYDQRGGVAAYAAGEWVSVERKS